MFTSLRKQFGTIGGNSPVDTLPIKFRSQSKIERILTSSSEFSLFKKLYIAAILLCYWQFDHRNKWYRFKKGITLSSVETIGDNAVELDM